MPICIQWNLRRGRHHLCASNHTGITMQTTDHDEICDVPICVSCRLSCAALPRGQCTICPICEWRSTNPWPSRCIEANSETAMVDRVWFCDDCGGAVSQPGRCSHCLVSQSGVPPIMLLLRNWTMKGRALCSDTISIIGQYAGFTTRPVVSYLREMRILSRHHTAKPADNGRARSRTWCSAAVSENTAITHYWDRPTATPHVPSLRIPILVCTVTTRSILCVLSKYGRC